MACEITTTTDQGAPAWRIETPSATYIYQPEAGGFSHLYDREGNDWIGFAPGQPKAPQGAGNVFRGFPNLVYPDNVGHPGYSHCRSSNRRSGDSVVLDTESKDERWAWSVEPADTHLVIDVTRAPEDRPYWFLFEGTPGGRYDPYGTFWGTPEGRRTLEEYGATLRPLEPFRDPGWVYFGHKDVAATLFCAHLTPDNSPTTLYFMNAAPGEGAAADGMVVFGFGRGPGTECHLRGRHRFAVGICERAGHASVAEAVEAVCSR
jgi:hypothetical protein